MFAQLKGVKILIELHHLRKLYRNVVNNSMIIQGRKKKLFGWQAIYLAQKAKQLPLCSKHYKMLHSNTLKKSDICESFLVNTKKLVGNFLL